MPRECLAGLISLSIYGANKNVFFLGFGIGIILQHTLTDGFRFIQKQSPPPVETVYTSPPSPN